MINRIGPEQDFIYNRSKKMEICDYDNNDNNKRF